MRDKLILFIRNVECVDFKSNKSVNCINVAYISLHYYGNVINF